MTIEFIFTFNKNKHQDVIKYPFVNPILKDKQTLFDFATAMLDKEDKNNLVKISCCVTYDDVKEFEDPQWYKDCEGKLYVENGKLVL